MKDINAALVAAHAAGDGRTLSQLYSQAANAAQTPDEQWFFLTHAYVFALEAGDAAAPALHQRLIDAGRDAADGPARAPLR